MGEQDRSVLEFYSAANGMAQYQSDDRAMPIGRHQETWNFGGQRISVKARLGPISCSEAEVDTSALQEFFDTIDAKGKEIAEVLAALRKS